MVRKKKKKKKKIMSLGQKRQNNLIYTNGYDQNCSEYCRESAIRRNNYGEFDNSYNDFTSAFQFAKNANQRTNSNWNYSNQSENREMRLEQYENSYSSRELEWWEKYPQSGIMPIDNFAKWDDDEFNTRQQVRMSSKGIYSQTKLPSQECRTIPLIIEWQNPNYHWGNNMNGYTEDSRVLSKNETDPNDVYNRDTF